MLRANLIPLMHIYWITSPDTAALGASEASAAQFSS